VSYTFDGPTKIISLSLGTTEFSVVDLWSRWCDWLAIGTNSKYLPAMRTVGADPISATKNLGSTFFMLNGWQIRPQEADHRLTVIGNLYTDPAGTSPFIDTLGAYNVTVEMQVSNLSDSTVAQMDQINAAVYRGQVAYDTVNGAAGDTFPKGTHEFPSNNWADTITIADNYGIEVIVVHGAATLTTGNNVANRTLLGENAIATQLVIESGANVAGCQFEDLFIINSVMDGYTYFKHTGVMGVSGFCGFMEDCLIMGSVVLVNTTATYFVGCKSGCSGVSGQGLPIFDLSAGALNIGLRNWSGPIKFINSTSAGNEICLDIGSGAVVFLDASCTAGSIRIAGICEVVNNSSMTVIRNAQMSNADMVSAMFAQAQTTPINGNMMRTNNEDLIGTGATGDRFRSHLVPVDIP